MDSMTDTHDDPRVPLAVERTLLAWIRTGLALMGFGFVVARLGLFLHEFASVQGEPAAAPRSSMIMAGSLLLTIGAVVNLAASIQHSRSRSARLDGVMPATIKFAAVVGVVTAALGLWFAVYLTLS
jgi:putative membrane protein